MGSYISLGIFIIIGVLLISVAITSYNNLVMLKHNFEKAFANIDVLLKQRADEIPNLINTVKEAVNFETKILENLTKLRTDFLNTQNVNKKIKLSNSLEHAMKSVFAVSENYPELKSSRNFLELQGRVSEIEDMIADRREFFNESVNMYNIGISQFPNLIFAKPLGYQSKELLEITTQEKEYNGVKF